MSSELILLSIMTLGLGLGGIAISLRAAEGRCPNPDSIHVREGLGHMLVGLFGWTGILSAFIGGVYTLGILRPASIAILLILLIQFTHFSDRIHRFYKLQLPLALASVLAGIWMWLSLFSHLQGVSNG